MSDSAAANSPESIERHADAAARLMKALSNRSRLMVLCTLAEGERSVSDLLNEVPLSQSALSQHLKRLRDDGLVTTRRDAQSIFYALSDERAARVVELLYQMYCGDDAARPAPTRR